MGVKIWTYRHRFDAEGRAYEVEMAIETDRFGSTLLRDGIAVSRDAIPYKGEEARRNQRLVDTLASGETLEVTAGYMGMWRVATRASVGGRTIHESHPGRRIGYPEALAGLTREDPGYDPEALKRNRIPIAVDIATGAVFFLVGWFFGLTTAAFVGAAIGVVLLVAQRFTRHDLLGGLALFGTAMLLASAGLALVLDSDIAVQLRSSILGTVSGVLFISDGFFGGRWLGQGLARYLAYSDVDLARLSLGMGAMTLVLAALNLVAALLLSERVWLVYSSFLDIPLVIAGFLLVVRWARRQGRTTWGALQCPRD